MKKKLWEKFKNQNEQNENKMKTKNKVNKTKKRKKEKKNKTAKDNKPKLKLKKTSYVSSRPHYISTVSTVSSRQYI